MTETKPKSSLIYFVKLRAFIVRSEPTRIAEGIMETTDGIMETADGNALRHQTLAESQLSADV